MKLPVLLLTAMVPALPVPAAPPDVAWPPALPGGKPSVTVRGKELLRPASRLRDGVTVAKTAPVVTFRYYDCQTYEGNPWSVWGDGLAVDGHYYSAVGDHRSPEGNAFLYDYDVAAGTLTRLADVRSIIGRPAGWYTPGKIHSRIGLGSDGWLYYSTHRGSTRVADDPNNHFDGDWILRTHPETGRSEVVVHAPLEMQCLPTGMLDPGRMIWYAGTADGLRRKDPQFLAYDLRAGKTLHAGAHGPHRAMIFAPSTGRIYFHGSADKADRHLYRFDPASPGRPERLDAEVGLRAATAVTPRGLVYTIDRDELWVFDTTREAARSLGPAVVAAMDYTTSIDADPTGRYLYYLPGAHGGSRDRRHPGGAVRHAHEHAQGDLFPPPGAGAGGRLHPDREFQLRAFAGRRHPLCHLERRPRPPHHQGPHPLPKRGHDHHRHPRFRTPHQPGLTAGARWPGLDRLRLAPRQGGWNLRRHDGNAAVNVVRDRDLPAPPLAVKVVHLEHEVVADEVEGGGDRIDADEEGQVTQQVERNRDGAQDHRPQDDLATHALDEVADEFKGKARPELHLQARSEHDRVEDEGQEDRGHGKQEEHQQDGNGDDHTRFRVHHDQRHGRVAQKKQGNRGQRNHQRAQEGPQADLQVLPRESRSKSAAGNPRRTEAKRRIRYPDKTIGPTTGTRMHTARSRMVIHFPGVLKRSRKAESSLMPMCNEFYQAIFPASTRGLARSHEIRSSAWAFPPYRAITTTLFPDPWSSTGPMDVMVQFRTLVWRINLALV